MKLTRIRNSDGTITPGVFLTDNEILNCSEFGEDWNEDFFGSDGLERLAHWMTVHEDLAPRLNAADVELAPAIARPSKIVCVGLNYAKHAAESGDGATDGTGRVF